MRSVLELQFLDVSAQEIARHHVQLSNRASLRHKADYSAAWQRRDWRWLCPQTVELVARNAFGDLYLKDEEGKVLRLDVAIGRLEQVANSEKEFRELAADADRRQEWFAEKDEQAAARRGLKASKTQCIAFKTPLVFAESGKPNNAYVADLYEQISFLGHLHRQLKDVPDGGKIQLKFTEWVDRSPINFMLSYEKFTFSSH